MKNSIVAVIFTLIVSVLYISQNIVYAAEDKARTITIHTQGLSDEAYYVDLLVKIFIRITGMRSDSRMIMFPTCHVIQHWWQHGIQNLHTRPVRYLAKRQEAEVKI